MMMKILKKRMLQKIERGINRLLIHTRCNKWLNRNMMNLSRKKNYLNKKSHLNKKSRRKLFKLLLSIKD